MQIIECTKCGSKNRIDPAKSGQAICGKCGAALSIQSQPVEINDENFFKMVVESPIPVLLDMWAAWCGPCRMIAPVINQLAGELAGKVLVAKLNVDENPRVTSSYGVHNIPTLLIFKGGKEVDRIVGTTAKEMILKSLRPYI
jgi:thioredoxin 2